jgi:hypothetical protein
MATGITRAQVEAWLGLSGKVTAPDDSTNLNMVVTTVNAYVGALPVVTALPRDPATPDVPADWPESVIQGAIMLAARYYRRRNSPNGVEAITEGGAQYVARYDSDIARLLGVEVFIRPAVG